MLAIVQARMTSERLPGKVLMDLEGKPMLGWTLARLRGARSLDRVIVATSDSATDDPVAAFCGKAGVPCHRGPLTNVARRMADAAQAERAPAFVRISGDSPLIDPAIVDQAVALYRAHECDLVTNVLVRSFPKGQSVEVLRTETLERLCGAMTSVEEQEHVTRAYYSRPDAVRVLAFTSGSASGAVQLSVDSRADFDAAATLIRDAMGRPAGWRELAEARKRLGS